MLNNTASTVIPIPSTYLQKDYVNFSKKKGEEIQNLEKFLLYSHLEKDEEELTEELKHKKELFKKKLEEIIRDIVKKWDSLVKFNIVRMPNISDDADEFLKKEPMIMDMNNKIIEKVGQLLENEEYEINLYMDEDMEIEDEETEYEELVISIKIDKSLEEEMRLWDRIEDEVDNIINQIEDEKKREEINRKISIEVVGLNNV